MKKSDWIALAILVFIVVGFGVSVTQNMKLRGEREELVNEIQDLNREIGEYKAMEDFYWEYTNLLDEIYQGKINEAVLEERIYWLEQYTEWLEKQQDSVYDFDYAQQMYDDILVYVEELANYYGVIEGGEYTIWFELNYPEIWERIVEYNDLF